jgi:hypothetical protein
VPKGFGDLFCRIQFVPHDFSDALALWMRTRVGGQPIKFAQQLLKSLEATEYELIGRVVEGHLTSIRRSPHHS